MEPDRPNIQIDDLVRPMTDEEYDAWCERQETIARERLEAGEVD